MESYKQLLVNNKAWLREKTRHNPSFFVDLAKDQKPEFLWIGCSDSRVPAEEITGAKPGDLFVHRNVANLIQPADINLMSVLHFAVSYLKVKHIVVCGHHGCGGVKAALGNIHLGLLDQWLEPLKDTYAKNAKDLEASHSLEDRINQLVELNVKAQVDALSKTYLIQDTWQREGRPMLHGWIYNLQTGEILDKFMKGPNSPIDSVYQFKKST